MENPINHLIQSAKDVRLTDEAKARVRERLVLHMREHPLGVEPVLSPYRRFIGVFSPLAVRLPKAAVMLPLVVLAFLGGATAYAAKGSLPGDTLYPIKVNVVEPVKGLFAVSPEAQAAWKVSLTETRLSEIEELAQKEELTPEVGVRGQARFDTSLTAARDTIKKLSQENPDAAIRLDASFSASLDKHEKILTTLGDSTTTKSAAEIHLFAKHVRSKINVPTESPSAATTTDEAATTTSATSTDTSTTSSSTSETATSTQGEDSESVIPNEEAAASVESGADINLRNSVPRKLGL
jgi:hypothetical protein